MEKFIKLLTLINSYYKKFLWFVIPLIIILMNFLDLLFLSMDIESFYAMVNICIIVCLLILLLRYLYYRKNDLFCLCATIAISYISILMSISRKIDIHPIVATALICIFFVTLIVSLMVRFYDFYHNGR